MTLGGMALAVGILVDDATVEIENIHRNMGMKKPHHARHSGRRAADRGARLRLHAVHLHRVCARCCCSPARRSILFTPLAMAVVFAMLDSYFLTRTLVPTMVHYLLASEVEIYQQGRKETPRQGEAGPSGASHHAFNRRFETMRAALPDALDWAWTIARWWLLVFGVLCRRLAVPGRSSSARDFFPYVDSGQMRLHVRAPEGTRIEETERIFAQVEHEIRRMIPADEIDTTSRQHRPAEQRH